MTPPTFDSSPLSSSSSATPLQPDAGLADAVERVARSVVGLASRRRGTASGWLWKPGLVVTTAAAVWRADKVRVVLPGGDHVAAAVRGVDAGTDLAVLAFDPALEALPDAAQQRSDSAPRAGDFVFAVGREPSGLVQASFGHVGAAGGEFRSWRGGRVDSLIRLDGGLYPGLQGGLVADAAGRLVGIASASFSRLHGVVLPLATIERIGSQLVASGRVAQGYIGIAAQTVPLADTVRSALATQAGLGLLVTSLADDGPAARAGVMVGDILISAAGQEVGSIEALREQLAADSVGRGLPLRLARGGQPLELAVDVVERPPHHAGRHGCR